MNQFQYIKSLLIMTHNHEFVILLSCMVMDRKREYCNLNIGSLCRLISCLMLILFFIALI